MNRLSEEYERELLGFGVMGGEESGWGRVGG